MMKRILAIETSCDETAVALVEGDGQRFSVVESVVASQISTHREYGGVVPEVAARMHVPVLPKMIEAMTGWKPVARKAVPPGPIDAVAVTAGPGLSTALRVGVETAKALATTWGVPLIPVDHIEGHIYANLLDGAFDEDIFPMLCLIVSGGHTELVLMQDWHTYEVIGQTRDDAVGEAFDKTAAQLGLSYPGGPSVSKAAEQGDPEAVAFPRPMEHSGDFDFSFSGLKTAVRNEIAARDTMTEQDVNDLAASFQAAAVDVLVAKTRAAAQQHAPNVVTICGGVSANKRLREQMKAAFAKTNVAYMEPELRYTTDNAAMIGGAAIRALADGRVAEDVFVIDADPARTLGGSWKWER